MKTIKTFIASLMFLLGGCSGQTPEDYANATPKLDLREYLNGRLEAWGVLFDYTGKVDRQFYVVMEGSWNGNEGTLKEWFTYSDGRKDERVWTVTYSDDHHFTGTAHDVIGKAEGKQFGNAVNMQYTLRAKRDSGDTIDLSMDDWMYLIDDKTLINRTTMKKFGLKVGELVIAFRKE
jgi:hypothetical protein